MNQLVKKNILGVEITDGSEKQILEYIFNSLAKKTGSYYIVTPNPEMVMRAQKDEAFKALLNNAEIALCDGVGLSLASKLLGKSLKERVTGVDLLEQICKESVRKPVSIGFLGGKDSVAEKTAECLLKKYPGLKVSFVGEEWRLSLSAKRQAPSVDILFVAFGFPKQEKWMVEHKDKGIYKVAMGVGGAFDYLSGSVPRAPKLMRAMGLEWFYRLIQQPWRWRRQLALISFIWLVVKEKLHR